MGKEDERGLARRARPVSGAVEDYRSEEEDGDGPSADDIARFSEVTVKCRGCGTELMDDVQECWKCGLPVGRHSHETGLPTWIVITAVVLLLLLAAWFFL